MAAASTDGAAKRRKKKRIIIFSIFLFSEFARRNWGNKKPAGSSIITSHL
jgi:hypothetical protein